MTDSGWQEIKKTQTRWKNKLQDIEAEKVKKKEYGLSYVSCSIKNFTVCSTLCLWIFSHGYFDPSSKKDQRIHTVVFLLKPHIVREL